MSSPRHAITTPGPWRWWHVVGLWSLVVAQPVYDVLRQNGDFFVAHRVSPIELILFVLMVSAVLPAFVALAIGVLSRASIRVGRAVQLAAVAGLVAALASQVLLKLPPIGLVLHLAVAAGLGVLAAILYARSSGVRWSLSLLTLGVPVFAGLFLFHPSMAPFIRPLDRTAQASAPVPPGSPPIVMVVFDQLPLASLMRPDGAIDAQHYPGFASLAAGSTWYPNATTTGDLTGWALPALMSGVLPRNGRLPIAEAHPQNLFTVLGDAYRFEVTEPITKLCPERLCPDEDRSTVADLISMTLDAAVVYAHVVTPRELRDWLPALTNDWRNFIQAEHWQWRWIRARDADRREPVLRFLDSIDGDEPQPTLYFLHALLPHEPYIYTRTGQQFTDDPSMRGVMRGERWTREEWPVTLAYTRHLLQLEYVDALVQRLLAKLHDEGLYDDALVIVTSDHGASFRPGHPWKGIDSSTLPDIMAVPLFIKAPGQKEGRVDTGNIQSIDILPTVADLLNVPLRRQVEGVSRLVAHDDTRKIIRHMGARRELSVDMADHARALRETIARRWSLFPDGVSPVPPNARRDLLGRPAPGAGSLATAGLQVLLEQPQLWQHVTPSAEMLPLRLDGRVFNAQGRPAAATLAVAVNGTIRAVTRTFDAPHGEGTRGYWTAYLRPDAVQAGRNLVQVFVVPDRGDDLQLAYSSAGRPLSLNLSSRAAADFWGVVQRGLSNRDDAASVPCRWTNGEASIAASMAVEPRPRSLRVGLAGPPLDNGPVHIRIDDCVLYDGPVDSRPWYRTFALDACPALASKADVTIMIRTGAVTGTDGQKRGVGLETVDLFPMPWPMPPTNPDDLHAELRVYSEHEVLARSVLVRVDIRNVGNAPWIAPTTDPGLQANVGVQLRWRSISSAVVDRTQILRIPRVMYPGDRLSVEIPLVPPPAVDGRGPWDVDFVPVTMAGQEIAVTTPSRLRVTSADSRSTG